MLCNIRETFTCKVNLKFRYYVEVLLKIMSISFLNFQSILSSLCLEANILILCESKVEMSSSFSLKIGAELKSRVLTVNNAP